jgi:hypothetical protein
MGCSNRRPTTPRIVSLPSGAKTHTAGFKRPRKGCNPAINEDGILQIRDATRVGLLLDQAALQSLRQFEGQQFKMEEQRHQKDALHG